MVVEYKMNHDALMTKYFIPPFHQPTVLHKPKNTDIMHKLMSKASAHHSKLVMNKTSQVSIPYALIVKEFAVEDLKKEIEKAKI